MLKRVRIKGYKSLEDIEVELKPLCVLFGPNASGKSNFLDALQLLSRIATSRTLKEAFEPPYRGKPLESFTFSGQGIKGLLAKETVSFAIEADVKLSKPVMNAVNERIREMRSTRTPAPVAGAPDERGKLALVREENLRYRIEIEIFPKSGLLRVLDEYLSPLTANGEPQQRRRPFLEQDQVDGRLHLRMEGQAHPSYHQRYLDHSILSLPLYPPHYPHVVAMREELASWQFFYFEPRERMRAASPVKEVRHIGGMGEELAAFLNTLKATAPRQFQAIEKALHMVVPSVTGIDVEVNDFGEVELRLREGDMLMPARVVSEGTLRVLGLLAAGGAPEPPALLGFEEPENGIHPRRIQLIAEMLKQRSTAEDTQFIVTTHSPLLPDLIPDESLFVCHKVGERTAITPFHTWGPLFRRGEVDKALTLDEELPLSARILRGDFDA